MIVGELYCHGCWSRTIHETEHSEAPDPLRLAIICTGCGRITPPAKQEFDPETGLPYDNPREAPGIPRGVLEMARAEMRQRWDADMSRSGVPIEVLRYPHRRS